MVCCSSSRYAIRKRITMLALIWDDGGVSFGGRNAINSVAHYRRHRRVQLMAASTSGSG
jgi:aromatic ring hydroxylase